MKTLKMSLENIQGKMNRKEMRNIMAGSGLYPTNFSCWCNGGANPPFLRHWTDLYGSADQIVEAITQHCSGGSGSCNPA